MPPITCRTQYTGSETAHVDGSDASGWVVAVPVALRASALPP
jgi:hypothetical protein